jgi:hypothetical protein
LSELVRQLGREVLQLRQEVNELRRENAELRQQAGYWKAMHARAVQRAELLVSMGPNRYEVSDALHRLKAVASL